MGAHMVPFGGWEMPLEYSGIVSEHMAVRTGVGLFDVSHMGEIEIDGKDALRLVQKITCNDASLLALNQAQYSGLMNDRGGLVDDLLVHKFAEDHYLLCVNASRSDADFDWILSQNDTGAQVRNTSEYYSQLALQGPRSREVLQPITTADLKHLKYYRFTRGKIHGVECIISRTGYTGEDGFEIYLTVEQTEKIWNELLDTGEAAGILPCGLGARNTLRLEAGMLLYGHDINEDTTPLEANLGWITKLDKGPFLGSDILKRQKREGVRRRLVGFEMTDRGIARDDAPVWTEDCEVGKVTSGSFAPFLKHAIGLAYVPSEMANPGQRILIQIRGNKAAARVKTTPFYRRAKSEPQP